MRLTRLLACTIAALLTASAAAAQSPNTGSLVVVAVDQSGAVMPGATVSVTNAQLGNRREAVTGGDGTVTITALPLTGTFTVAVAKTGFTTETVKQLALRGGETATVRVKLNATGGRSEVTVYGTSQGPRADPQIGRRFDSTRIDETPILGRKITSLPLFNAAFRPAKGTGDLFVNATYFVT